jgi:secreted trypsin-like serine protease
MNKIGKTTGWTYGNVNATCVDLTRNYERELCSTKAHTEGGQGDSGGPFFSWDGEDGVVLYGISFQLDECTYMSAYGCMDHDVWFSVMAGITGDLGAMTVTLGTAVGTPSPSGSVSGGQPLLSWSSVSTTNAAQVTRYLIYRSAWDASTYSWIGEGQKVGETTSTSFSDTTFPLAMNTYVGTSQPNQCVYSYIRYTVRAYNTGVAAESSPVYFQGAADGPTPTQIVCP